MRRSVVKFGGSNMKSSDDIARICRAVESYPVPPVIVVSALYGVTDRIAWAVERVRRNENEIADLKTELLKSHMDIIDRMISDSGERHIAHVGLERRVEKLGRYLLGIHCLGEVPGFVREKALSFGERLSSLMLSSILSHKGIRCEETLPEQLVLLTDGKEGDASADLERIAGAISEWFSGRPVCVVPGFYGISPEGRVNTFGRGGGDYTASVLARCIGAESVDLWKDVSGFMSSDPKLVEGTVSISELSFREAAELSYFGARIVHPRTFEPLHGTDTVVRIFDISKAGEELNPGTVISPEGSAEKWIVKSVSRSDDLGVLKLKGPGVGIRPGVLAHVSGTLHDAGINIRSVITSQTCINILLSSTTIDVASRLIGSLAHPAVDEISIDEDVALVGVVGEGMKSEPGVAARVMKAVSRKGINVKILSGGASEAAVYVIIEKKDGIDAVRSIHSEFFNGGD